MINLGAALPIWATDGYARTSDAASRATPGNGFRQRFHEDFAQLRDHGLLDVRLSFDWSRLLPDLRKVDNDEREHLTQVLDAAEAAGCRVWATLYEGPVPREFAGEGGWSDDKAAGRWWPRWVETAAELFGDRVSGWFPMHHPVGHALREWGDQPDKLPDVLRNQLVGWRDAWRILRGGPPVATSLGVWTIRPADQSEPSLQNAKFLDTVVWRTWSRALRDGTVSIPGKMERQIDDLAGACNINGVSLAADFGSDVTLTDNSLRRFAERNGEHVRRIAEQYPDRPLVVSSFRANRASDADRTMIFERFAGALRDAAKEGFPLTTAFVEPGIDPHVGGGRECDGLITRDREVKQSAHALIAALAAP